MSDSPDIGADKPQGKLPSAEEVKSSVVPAEDKTDQVDGDDTAPYDVATLKSEKSYAHLRGLKEHYGHKKYWSFFIMLLMAFMIGFQCWLLWKVGIGAWSFEKYAWLLPDLLVQNLAQVAGLAVFVVKALFQTMEF